MIYIGDQVCKRSRKSFENGRRVLKVVGYTYMDIPDRPDLVDAVELEGCLCAVTNMTIHTDPDEIELLLERDQQGFDGSIQPKKPRHILKRSA